MSCKPCSIALNDCQNSLDVDDAFLFSASMIASNIKAQPITKVNGVTDVQIANTGTAISQEYLGGGLESGLPPRIQLHRSRILANIENNLL